MVHELAYGKIIDIDPDGMATIKAQLPNLDRAITRKYEDVEIMLNDGRHISAEQRRKVFLLIAEITEYIEGFRNAETIEETKNLMKWQFIMERLESQERKLFSLANCDMTLARNFIDYLISFIIKNDIPSSVSLLDNCEDVGAYIYACAINKRCVICGKKAQWHHAEDRVGMGRNREEICHIGMRGMPLCEEHHELSHTMPQNEFNEKYHIQSIKVDEKIAKKYKLKHDEVKI